MRRLLACSAPAQYHGYVADGADEGQSVQVVVTCPPELEGGSYANFLNVWHTAYEFTLDFAAMLPAEVPAPGSGEDPVRIPCKVVSRIRIPPSLIFEVIKAINTNMGKYEQNYGPIPEPGGGQDAPQ
jgi:hypothetical protein